MADVDAPFMKQFLDVPQRQRKPDIQHYRQADDLGAGFEVLERGAFDHHRKLDGALPLLKQSSSDRAVYTLNRHRRISVTPIFQAIKIEVEKNIGRCFGLPSLKKQSLQEMFSNVERPWFQSTHK